MFRDQPPALGTVGRRLFILGLVVIGVLIYAYGWRITDISLEEPQDPDRRGQLSRALRELLSPNIFEQDTDSELTSINFVADRNCEDQEVPEQSEVDEGEPYITVSTFCGFSDDTLVIEGHNFEFHPRNSGIIRWRLPNNTIPIDRFQVDRDGNFRNEILIPRLGRVSGDNNVHTIEAESFVPTGSVRFTETSHTVFEKMIETIFLALMATTLALPIAVALSFFAARNLMRQLTMPLGPVLAGVIFFPIGWWLGSRLLGRVGEEAVDAWGRVLDGDVGRALLTIVTLAGLIFLLRMIESTAVRNMFGTGWVGSRLRQLAFSTVMLVIAILSIGILGGLALWLGTELQDTELFYDLGNMSATIGELVGLIVSLMAGLLAAFYLSSLASTIAAPLFKVIPAKTLPSYLLAAVLAALVVGMLLYGLAELSHQAALLILLVPLAAAFTATEILPMVYDRIFQTDKTVKAQGAEKATLDTLSLIGAAIVFVLVFELVNAERGIIDGRRPLTEELEFLGMNMKIYSFRALLAGLGIGALRGGLAGVHYSFPLGMIVYNTTRTILNALRSIEPLIMGIVFVIWVGIGPFAGMLALALHSIASLGKLYSEQVENIDSGPIEAVQATGANRLQVISYAVVPQIVPPYIAFTMYRWDINVRMSTIIGFVGGGGIGFLLSQQINQLRYQEAGVAVLAIAIVVTILDYTSAYIRERMI